MKALAPTHSPVSQKNQPEARQVGLPPYLKWPSFLISFLIIIAALPWMFALLDRPVVTATHRMVGDHGQDRLIWELITTLGLGYLWIIFFIGTSLCCLIGQYVLSHQNNKNPHPSLNVGYQRLDTLLFNCLSSTAGLIIIMPIIYVLKVCIGRIRPGQFVNNNVYLFDPFHRWDLGGALPSGHSADIAAACVGLLLWFSLARTTQQRYLFWTWQIFWLSVMLLVAISRIFLWVHFPSDTITGLYLGAMAACLGRAFVFKIKPYLHKKLNRNSLSLDCTA